jgi:hypothetical protein
MNPRGTGVVAPQADSARAQVVKINKRYLLICCLPDDGPSAVPSKFRTRKYGRKVSIDKDGVFDRNHRSRL